MASCDPQQLITAGQCYVCGIIPGTVQWMAVKLAILCRIKNGVTMACDLQTLIDESKCFLCQPIGQLYYIELAILCQIATSGGAAGTGGSVLQGNGPPGSPPVNATVPAIYTDLLNGQLYTWNVVTQAWI